MTTGKNEQKSPELGEAGNQETTEEADAPFDDGFDENLMAGEDDRQRLAFMSERQREIELYNRAQRREALLARFTVRQKLMQKKLSQGPAAKEQTTESEKQDEAENEAASKRKETAHSAALERLIAERKRKRLEKDTVPVQKSDVLSSSNSDTSSDSSGSESDDSSDSQTDEHHRKATTTICTKEQLSRLRLSRFKLANWCHAPFFREVAIGSFVKIGVGVVNGQSVYRIAEIVDIVTVPKPYEFEGTRTDKAVRLRHSNSERNFKMAFVSNAQFTDSEFDRWIHTMTKQKQPIPTLEQMELKESVIKYYMDYVYMDEDVEQIVREKMRLKLCPTNFAVARADLKLEMDIARENKDVEKLKKLEEQMRELDKLSAEARKDGNLTRLDEINRRNRQNTLINVEAALLRDAKENKDSKPDPFTRRRCLPTMVTKSRVHSHSDEKTSCEDKTEKVKDEPMIEPSPKKPIHDPLTDVDLFSIHNFDLDIQLPSFDSNTTRLVTQSTRAPVQPVPPPNGLRNSAVSSSACPNNKRLLNLEEYKKRRGLI